VIIHFGKPSCDGLRIGFLMWLWGYPCNFTIESLLLCVKLQEPKALLEDHNKDTKADGKHESEKLTGK
jgi:hypothetical protein